MGGLGLGVPMAAMVASATASNAWNSMPLWLWPTAAVLCIAFGVLAAIGFTYDIVREAVVDDAGLVLRTANRQLRYEWDEIEPRARVFPRRVRFKAHDGTLFFLTTRMVERLNALPFGPTWNVSELGRW